jgi:hypothetical protein
LSELLEQLAQALGAPAAAPAHCHAQEGLALAGRRLDQFEAMASKPE